MSPRAAWRLESLGFAPVYDYLAGKADWLAAGLPSDGRMASVPRAGHLARVDLPTCALNERLGVVRERVQAAGWESCVVVNDQRVVLGRLGRKALEGQGTALVEDSMDPGPSTYRPDVLLEELAHYMHHHDVSRALITTSEGKLVGLVLRANVERRMAELGLTPDEPGQRPG
jgi:CBS domain-containing protein